MSYDPNDTYEEPLYTRRTQKNSIYNSRSSIEFLQSYSSLSKDEQQNINYVAKYIRKEYMSYIQNNKHNTYNTKNAYFNTNTIWNKAAQLCIEFGVTPYIYVNDVLNALSTLTDSNPRLLVQKSRIKETVVHLWADKQSKNDNLVYTWLQVFARHIEQKRTLEESKQPNGFELTGGITPILETAGYAMPEWVRMCFGSDNPNIRRLFYNKAYKDVKLQGGLYNELKNRDLNVKWYEAYDKQIIMDSSFKYDENIHILNEDAITRK